MSILGVDFSENQTTLPWSAWASKLGFAIGRSSIGYRQDVSYPEYLTGAANVGIKNLGAYHVILHHDAEIAFFDPVRQADVFISRLKALPLGMAFLDIEAAGVTEAMVRAFCDYYDANGTVPLGLYGNLSLEGLLGPNRARYAKYPLWQADYGPGLITSTPPAGNFPRALNIGHRVLWQFAGNNGRLAPYTKPIDLSQFDGSEQELATLFGHSITPPTTLRQELEDIRDRLNSVIARM